MRLLIGILVAFTGLAQTFEARHDHLRGECTGRLTFDENGVAFESEKKPKHSWRVSYLDAQQIRALDNGDFRLLTYRDHRWRLGADVEHRLRVADANFAAQVAPMLERRLERRFVSGVAGAAKQPLWQIPAKHRLRFSGTEGALIAAEDRVVYRTEKPGHSREWLLSDIESISSSDPYQFTLTTYEHARSPYGGFKGFNFQLKQPLSADRYNDLWQRLERFRRTTP